MNDPRFPIVGSLELTDRDGDSLGGPMGWQIIILILILTVLTIALMVMLVMMVLLKIRLRLQFPQERIPIVMVFQTHIPK